VDFPAVPTAGERLVPERPNAHVTGADVRDPAWLDTIPAARSVTAGATYESRAVLPYIR
jgi:hypothetical protein